MISQKNIIGLYTTVDELTWRPKCRLVIIGENGQFMKSPILNMSVEMLQDLQAHLPKEKAEYEVMSMILKEFKQEQYTIMSAEDISQASKEIKYLETMILRDRKIDDILKS